ncbi:hypothetical protein OS493_031946 [Desmophyllum pertusum]|uniref:Uncharacterized protein n=1 Tax=Desmophyllum pertusum TaxID=174260 RepID=A0A9X0D239_9CNID|nr:hypothetical protein OS493_031946 [Desmophyllum pertusum]
MAYEQQLSVHLSLIFLLIFLADQSSEALSFKAGKENITIASPGLFACKEVSFQDTLNRGQDVKVLASVGHAVKSETTCNGAAIWVEDVTASGFTVCVLEFGDGSNDTAEVNWIAVQSAPSGSQLGATSLSTWTTGTECKRIDFQQRFSTLPTIFVTASHQFPKRPQDAMAVWVEDLREDNFKICLREAKIFDGPHRNLKIVSVFWFVFLSRSTTRAMHCFLSHITQFPITCQL